MTKNEGYYQKKMAEYHKERCLQNQKDFPIKNWIVHQELDKIHDRAFKAAWNSLQAYKEQFTPIGREIKNRNLQLKKGNASKAKNMIQNLINNFEKNIDPKDQATNCLDVAIITAPEKRTQKTIEKLKTVAGRVLKK